MPTTRRQKYRPSKDQVRAWLTTVVAPLARALAVEQHRAASGNRSFRCDTQDFEFLWPIDKMIAVSYAPNLQQLFRYRSDVKALADGHDHALNNLRARARDAYSRLVQNEGFRMLASSTPASEHEQKYLAEYVVNGLRDLLSYYQFHELWSREGGKFLALREDPTLASEFRSFEASGREFSNSVTALLRIVGALQIELADSYKLPPVEPVDTPV
jgi:hypothetical protein